MDISKFNWREMFNNDSGKTSGSAFGGLLSIVVACAACIIGCITKNNEILSTSCFFLGGGAALLGVRKFVNNKESIKDTEEETK